MVSLLINGHQDVFCVFVCDSDSAAWIFNCVHTVSHYLLHLRKKSFHAVLYNISPLVAVHVHCLLIVLYLQRELFHY